MRYAYTNQSNEVNEVAYDSHRTFQELQGQYTNYGLSVLHHERNKRLYGPNQINVSLRLLLQMISNELLNPFYLFQIISVAFWYYEGYAIYASVVVGLTLLSTGTSVLDMLGVLRTLRKENEALEPALARLSNLPDPVLIESAGVVPELICRIVRPQRISFDCIVMSGRCYVKETSVTGDPALKVKSALPASGEENTCFDILHHREHTIYGGSSIEDVPAPCEVLVVNTGFSTVQGKLIREMLYPPKDRYVQYEDAVWFALFLAVISIVGFCICVPTFMSQKLTLRVLIENLFDLITVAVPPILPAAMSIGTSLAIQRLRSKGIYCISPAKVAVAGKVSIVCIDTMGTLVEEECGFVGYRLVRLPETGAGPALQPVFGRYNNRVETISTYFSISKDTANINKMMKNRFSHALATCHRLTLYKGEISGTREDSELFASTGAVLTQAEAEGSIAININNGQLTATQLRKNYNEKKQILSVVVKYSESDEVWAYSRVGAMSLLDIANPTNLPSYWKELVSSYERDCNLVFGVCAKKLASPEAAQGDWAELIRDMDLSGIVVLKLTVKEHAADMVASLKRAKLPCLMFCPENPVAAVAVAKSVGIIAPNETIVLSKPGRGPDSAVQWVKIETNASGKENNRPNEPAEDLGMYLDPRYESSTKGKLLTGVQLLSEKIDDAAIVCDREAARFMLTQRSMANSLRLIKQTRIFAGLDRGGPAVDLINTLSRCGESVLMVGSPFSEYGALSKSDVGILLSPAKQLCVFAAFTCSRNDISGVPMIIAEGRAALVTTYECFKWMAMSSIIQFAATTILYYYSLSMTDQQYLYTDLLLVLPLAFTMSWSRPSQKLTAEQPQSSLLSIPVLASVAGQMIIQICSQVYFRADLRNVDSDIHCAGQTGELLRPVRPTAQLDRGLRRNLCIISRVASPVGNVHVHQHTVHRHRAYLHSW